MFKQFFFYFIMAPKHESKDAGNLDCEKVNILRKEKKYAEVAKI